MLEHVLRFGTLLAEKSLNMLAPDAVRKTNEKSLTPVSTGADWVWKKLLL